MKYLTYLLFAFFLVTQLSCSKEDNVEEITTVENENENPNPQEPGTSVTTACDFELAAIASGATIDIDCILDLKGQTIRLPRAVTLIHSGGDIINGTLDFADDGKIDGQLLNASLTIDGNATLTTTVFDFVPGRWKIVEGKVDNTVSRNNRDILEMAMQKIKDLGGDTFSIDVMDAYFNVDESSSNPTQFPSLAAITLPESDFTLKMTSNTHLRMQPNAAIRPTLLATFRANNIIIDGGVLHGDREEHDYTTISSTHEWGHLLRISGTKNSVFKNITFMDATGDAVDVHANGHSFDSHYAFCENVTITNNTMLRSRRNHISITDGRAILVEGNDFIDASIHMPNSRGTAPGFAIDVEAVRHGNPRGISEIAEDINIKSNSEKGSRIGAVTVHTGDRVTIEENKFESSISYSTSIGTIIRNNEIVATRDLNVNTGTAIVAGRDDVYDKNFGGRVYGNTIKGYAIGITITNKDMEVYDNDILDCKAGLRIATIRDAKIFKNTITSTRADSDGIVSHPTLEYMDNVVIGGESQENTIEVTRTPVKFVNVNNEPDAGAYKVQLLYNSLSSESTSTFSNVHGFEFSHNIIKEGGIRLVNTQNASITNNTIRTTVANGIRLDTGCQNIAITGNEINVAANFDCIKQTAADGVNITIADTGCNK